MTYTTSSPGAARVGQDGGDARDRLGAAIDDAVEVDEEEETHAPDRSGASGARVAWRTMPDSDRDPLAATVRLLVDGTNLLHAMSRRPGAAPPAALVGRLRGAIPAFITIELVFDGPAEPGLRGERIASGRLGPLQRRPDRRRRDPDHGRRGPQGRRRRRHGGPPGRHRRPRAPLRGSACAGPGRPARSGCSGAWIGPAGLAVGRQSASGPGRQTRPEGRPGRDR